MRLSSPIYTLKRQAKLLARDNGTKLHKALNQIAAREGFKDWSHLSYSYTKTPPAKEIMSQLNSGDVVLIGARPGHGKTLLGLELAALAKKNRRIGYVFSLEYNDKDVWDRYEKLGLDPNENDGSIVVDTSDAICAAHIIERLATTSEQAFIVVDYLQLLDQKRGNPPLEEQIRALKKYAIVYGAVVVLISQIDRAFELSTSTMPTLADIRLPNPLDLSLFDKKCFIHDGQVQMEAAS